MARRIKEQFIWIPPDRTGSIWNLTIKDIDVRTRIIGGNLSFGLMGEELSGEIILENSDEGVTGLFSENDIVSFKFDYTNGTTKQFEGEVESIIDSFNNNYQMKIVCSHYTSRTSDIMVTKEYTNSTVSDIRINLISIYMTGYTSTNVETNNIVVPKITFVNKPFQDCMLDLNVLGGEDCYIDNDKGFNSFKRGSKNNDNEALVIYDTMFDLKGLGVDNTRKRTRVQVIGDAGGLPVIYTSSFPSNRTRERVITETNVNDESIAQDLADAELARENNPDKEGNANCIFMNQLLPGYMTYIVMPNYVHSRFRLSKWTFNLDDYTMDVIVSEKRTLGKLFKDKFLKDLSQEKIVNPNNMLYSYNLVFTELNKVDLTSSDNISLESDKLRLNAGQESGNMITNILTTTNNVTSVQLLILGENLTGLTYFVNTDGTTSWQSIDLNILTTVTSSGKSLRFRIRLTNTTTRISSVALLYT